MTRDRKSHDKNLPVWFDGQSINEALFCEEFLQQRKIIFANRAFFTPDGRVTDELMLWCEENSLTPLKARSFSDAMVANAKKFHLEHTNKIINSAGRRVWRFTGVESVFKPDNNGFYDASQCTYVPEEWRD